ncbi:VOC family protein [Sphingomonas sp. G124]|uniref:VOC family protein n=1 Tax=Sphingomonas cremea TaxID=2904799 RepID=A0A9X1QL11_9SPHN|nr:VOC family protein [Sphingomonas cremea]MCF2514092.1 VOC family protein [Sphingomonas cremea]
MRTAFIEHVNLTVTDPERSAELMNRLFGWKIRWSGPARDGGRAVHVGDDTFYLALFAPAEGGEQQYPKGEPLNHVGLVVDDLDGAEQRVIEAGLAPFAHADYEPGRRFYFFDHNGIEFELVNYA